MFTGNARFPLVFPMDTTKGQDATVHVASCSFYTEVSPGYRAMKPPARAACTARACPIGANASAYIIDERAPQAIGVAYAGVASVGPVCTLM